MTRTADDSTTAAPTTEAPTSEPFTESSSSDSGDAQADIGSVAVTAVSFTDGAVTIRNDGAEAIDLTGYAICNRPNYGSPPEATVELGATLEIDVGDLDIRASGGEFGLFRSTSFDSAEVGLNTSSEHKPSTQALNML